MQSLLDGTPTAWQIAHELRVTPATAVVALECSDARLVPAVWHVAEKHPELADDGRCAASIWACCGAGEVGVWQLPCAQVVLDHGGGSWAMRVGWQALHPAAAELELGLACSGPSSRLWQSEHAYGP